MSKTKKILREIHGIVGLLVGLIVLVVSISGCIYAFQPEIRNLLYPHLLKVEVPEHPQRLSVDSLASLASAHYSENPIREIVVSHTPDRSVRIYTWNHHLLYMNPYTGDVLGLKNQLKDPFLMAWTLHTQLGLGKTGGVIVGYSTLTCIPLIITGLWLWWPAVRRSWRKALSLPLKGSWRRLNFQWHKNSGFYMSIFLLLICLSGLMMSFTWFEQGVYRITGSPQPRKTVYNPIPYTAPQQTDVIQRALSCTLQKFPDHKETAIFFPRDAKGTYMFIAKEEDRLGRRNILYFSPTDGTLLEGRYYSEYNTGDKLKAVNYNIHSGKIGGLPGRIIAFIATAFAGYLVISGYIMWFQRKFSTGNSKKQL